MINVGADAGAVTKHTSYVQILPRSDQLYLFLIQKGKNHVAGLFGRGTIRKDFQSTVTTQS